MLQVDNQATCNYNLSISKKILFPK